MAKKRTKTFVFLTTDPELGLGAGYPVLGNYIASGKRIWSMPKGLPKSTVRKLEILKGMFDRGEFSRNKRGYYLSLKDIEHYRKLYKSETARKARKPGPHLDFKPTILELSEKARKPPPIAKKPILPPVARFLSSLSAEEKDWESLPEKKKVQFAELLKKEIRQLVAFDNAIDPAGESKISPHTLLELSVGHKMTTDFFKETFLSEVIRIYKRLEPAGAVGEYPELTMDFIIKAAGKSTMDELKGPSRTDLMDQYEGIIKEIPAGFGLLLENLREVQPRPRMPKLKLPAWATPMKEPTAVERWWNGLSKARKDQIRKNILWIAEVNYGIKLDLKDLNIPKDTLIGLRLGKTGNKEAENVFRDAFVQSFLEKVYMIRNLSKLKARDFHDCLLSAHTDACRKLNAWMKGKEEQMMLAKRKAPIKAPRKAVA